MNILIDSGPDFEQDIQFLSNWGELRHGDELIGHHLYLNNFACLSFFSDKLNTGNGDYYWELRQYNQKEETLIGSGKTQEDYYLGNCKDALKYYIWYCESEGIEPHFSVKRLKKFL
jgi:hypothetical protein